MQFPKLAIAAFAFVVLSTSSLRTQGPQVKAPINDKDSIPGIVFVAAPMFDEKTDGGEGVYQGSYHWRDGYIYARSATYHWPERTMGPVRPGKNLFSLVPAQPNGKLTQLTFLKTGAVFKPEPSYDGKKILFSLRRDDEDWFHLCEMNVDGSSLRQLTDGPFNDFSGVYLPDGRIVFCSDRTGYLEEYHEERAECLFVMNADGTGIQQITFMPGTYFEPSVMKDGRILFSFWDAFHINVPPLDKHETYLMTVHPDGTEERHLFGAGQYRFFDRERHSGVGLTQAREMPDGRILCQSEMGPSLIDLNRGLNIRDALTPIFPGTTSVQLGGTTHRVHLSPLGTRSTGQPLPDGRILFSATPPGARDSAIYACDPDSRDEKLVLNIPNYAEFDAVPILVEREKPRRLPVKLSRDAQRSATPTTRFVVVAGRDSDNPKRSEALKKARYFRVIEAEYSGVTTSSHTNLETRILGVAPIFEDGSCYFEAPADTPLFLDALDAGGNRVLHEWTYPTTATPLGTQVPVTQQGHMVGRAGETKSCYGCHASQTTAVPNTTMQALKHPPVKITRKSTDLQYRRNEPENYRTQARLGDAAKYRLWLKSPDPVIQARGCEILMLCDDSNAEDAEEITKILVASLPPLIGEVGPENAELARSAALALTRLATGKQRPLLSKLLDATRDELVRIHINNAVDAIATRNKAKPMAKASVETLWKELRQEVPNKQVLNTRYFQHGPRPEEYARLKELALMNATPRAADVHLLIAMLPNAFMEKPRFEDRMREESQRVLLPRLLLENAGFREPIVQLLLGKAKHPVLEAEIIKGINLERPFSEHGRPFPVIKAIGPEEALWLLTCLAKPGEVSEDFAIPYLPSKNHRERIDAAVLLALQGFGEKGAKALEAEALKPYTFPEIASIGKGMPDENFRDKAYMVMALAMHVEDVNRLKPFADPKTMYRDIRYGLARGLARRGKADAFSILVEMATRDPITLIRQQARYAVADIQDACRLSEKGTPIAWWPESQPLEALYPPRKIAWSNTEVEAAVRGISGYGECQSADPIGETRKLAAKASNFRNLNMAQARGAERLMIAQVEDLDLEHANATTKDSYPSLWKELLRDSRPFPRYLGLKKIPPSADQTPTSTLINSLSEYAKTADTVGFWWCCEALGKLRAKDALPLLAKYAVPTNPPNVFGPPGMGVGYIASKAYCQIAADPKEETVAKLLASDNIWLRAGALCGMAEAKVPGIEKLLKDAATEENPLLVKQEAEVQLRRLKLK